MCWLVLLSEADTSHSQVTPPHIKGVRVSHH